MSSPPVAVFDIDLPPGIAFLRSLGRAGVPTIGYSSDPRAAGRFSRFASEVRSCPPPTHVDEFTGWLESEMAAGSVHLVAPTSDWVAFSTAAARTGPSSDGEAGAPLHAVLDCLLKPRFAEAMAEVGFPTPEWATPETLDDATVAAAGIGYPIVVKPRSHVGVGRHRGVVVHSEAELREAFAPWVLPPGQSLVIEHDRHLALPMLQAYHAPEDTELLSISGCLGEDGEVLAVGHSRKLLQWPEGVGVGTVFEAVGPVPFTERALHAVRTVLGRGIFELEVLVDRTSPHRYWAIDLNPRAFGQISLDIANGRDLPLIWHRSVTGQSHPARAVPPRRHRRYWHGPPFLTGAAVRMAIGPNRRHHYRHVRDLLSLRHVGSTRSWSDPLPGLVHWLAHLRHPGGLIRPCVKGRRR